MEAGNICNKYEMIFTSVARSTFAGAAIRRFEFSPTGIWGAFAVEQHQFAGLSAVPSTPKRSVGNGRASLFLAGGRYGSMDHDRSPGPNRAFRRFSRPANRGELRVDRRAQVTDIGSRLGAPVAGGFLEKRSECAGG